MSDLDLLTNQFFTLLAMLDPVSHMSLFLGATDGLNASQRRRAAVVGVAVAFGILIFFAVVGQVLLHAMGISLRAFQIAGGIILLLFALKMVLGDPPAAAKSGSADKESALAVAIYPLATPIIAGPGAMLAIILLTDNNRFTFAEQAETAAVLAVVLTILLGAFLLGDVIRKAIGQGGTNVIRRIMGVILAALSVNMLGNALADWLRLPPL